MPASVSSVTIPSPANVRCVICCQHVPLTKATAGSRYADGSQAFACRGHLADGDRTRWIICWAIFESEQQGLQLEADISEALEW